MKRARQIAGGILLAASVGAFVWEWFAAAATEQYFRKNPPLDDVIPDEPEPDADFPPASILVPLRGNSKTNRESLHSLLNQDYPAFEVIVGVEERDLRSAEFVRSLQQETAIGERLRLVTAPNRLGGRAKVGNLYNALQATNAGFLAMVDADVTVGPRFLRSLVSPLLDQGVGLTTCFYRGSREGGAWSTVDALWTSTAYLPAAIFGRRVIGEGFAFGAAIGTRRDVLQAIGGFEAIAPRVGDDYQLGARTAAQGFRVEFVPYLVTEQMPNLTLPQLIDRRVRWSRTIRTFQTAGYIGWVVTYGVPAALLAAIAAPTLRSRWLWLGAVTTNRLICARMNQRRLDPVAPPQDLWLVPVRDVIALIVWALGFTPARRPMHVK